MVKTRCQYSQINLTQLVTVTSELDSKSNALQKAMRVRVPSSLTNDVVKQSVRLLR